MKPSLFKNELLATSDPLHAWIFEGLWCMADRAGRLEDRPRRIHLEVNPGRAFEGTETSLEWLSTHGFIIRYQHGEARYIQIVNFEKHQHPHIKEPQSVIPGPGIAPDEHRTSTVLAPDEHGSSPSLSPFPITDSPFLKTKSAERPQADPSSPAIPLQDGAEYWPPADLVAEWKTAYPNIVVAEQLLRIAAWNRSNPGKRKTRRGITKHINEWLSRADKEATKEAAKARLADVQPIKWKNRV